MLTCRYSSITARCCAGVNARQAATKSGAVTSCCRIATASASETSSPFALTASGSTVNRTSAARIAASRCHGQRIAHLPFSRSTQVGHPNRQSIRERDVKRSLGQRRAGPTRLPPSGSECHGVCPPCEQYRARYGVSLRQRACRSIGAPRPTLARSPASHLQAYGGRTPPSGEPNCAKAASSRVSCRCSLRHLTTYRQRASCPGGKAAPVRSEHADYGTRAIRLSTVPARNRSTQVRISSRG